MRLLVWLCSCLLVVHAQEFPIYFVEKFDQNVSYRTNVCDRQAMLWNSTIDLPSGLRGLEFTVGIAHYKTGKEKFFFTLDKNNKFPPFVS